MVRTNLVTGAFGFSGSHVIARLLDAGERVIGTDLGSRLADAGVRADMVSAGIPLDHPNLELIGASLLDPKSLATLFEREPDRVFHTASLYDYSASLELLRSINGMPVLQQEWCVYSPVCSRKKQ